MCGFGLVQPFPGIVAWHLDTAVTLPVGVEAYAAFALGAWLRPGTPLRARRFAKFSAIASLALGVLGQVAYHLLAAAHAARAPWPVVVLVSSLPVVVLGLASGLAHLLREAGEAEPATATIPAPDATAEAVAETVAADVDGSVLVDIPVTGQVDVSPGTVYPAPANRPRTVAPARARRAPAAKAKSPERIFAAELAAGELPSVRSIKTKLRVGTPRAQEIRDSLAAILEAPEAA